MPEATVNNVRLYYRDAGHGAPLLLLHGLGSSGRIWDSPQGFPGKSPLTPPGAAG